MDYQTTIDRRRPGYVRQQLGELVHDALTLGELQVQLFKVDLRDARKGVSIALALVGIGVVLALGSIPVLLFAAAQGLVSGLSWPAPWAYLAVGAAAVIVAGVLVWVGVRQASVATGTMHRSTAEFAETLKWFKGSLRGSGRSELGADIDSDLWTSRSRV
jgi:hypothetical protein